MSATIQKIIAREIIDSRGHPTVETAVTLSDRTVAVASVPSGKSTGVHEALELRDGDQKRFHGQGVMRAVEKVNGEIFGLLNGKEADNQIAIDRAMLDLDGTDNKSNLGANAILSVSLACARAAAISHGVPLYRYLNEISGLKQPLGLPTVMFNVINGGEHADTNMDIQEFMFIPTTQESLAEHVRAAAEVFHDLGEILRGQKRDTDIGNEGGYAPEMLSYDEPFKFIIQAAERTGRLVGEDFIFGIDAGASTLLHEGAYNLSMAKQVLSAEQLGALYMDWVNKFHLQVIEDPFGEDEWPAWTRFTAKHGKQLTIIGDDLLVTDPDRIAKAAEQKACNAALIKVNQIGSVSETLAAVRMAREHRMQVVVSHRSGETADDFIADLAVAVAADKVKMGAPSRGERVVKYNRLMAIEKEIGA